jgi:hypothetical protein
MHDLAVSSKANTEIVDRSVISGFSAKIVQTKMVEMTVTRLKEIIVLIFAILQLGRTA